jgi:short-subunit dehydrogenase
VIIRVVVELGSKHRLDVGDRLGRPAFEQNGQRGTMIGGGAAGVAEASARGCGSELLPSGQQPGGGEHMPELAVVTGASSGIGEAYAQRLAADGWDLIVVARREDRLHQLAARLTDAYAVTAQAIPADLADPAEVQRICGEIAAMPVGMLVNNAGLAHYMPFADLAPAQAGELMDLNVLAPVLLTRAALPGMLARSHGTVINVASLLAFSGAVQAPFLPKRAVYAATKSFLVTFSQALAAEVADRGVQIQVVCPGVVRSEFHSRQGMDMSAVPRMEPGQVVEASLADLADGVVVSVPGLGDTGTLARLEAAGQELVGAARTAELPARYRRSIG